MSDVSNIVMGSSPNSANIGQNSVYTEFHQGKIYFTDKVISSSDKYTSEISKMAEKNSVLLCVRAPVGEVNITDRDICIGRGLSAIHPLGNINVLLMFYWLQCLKKEFNLKATGSTFVAITADTVYNQLIPLPPIEEQSRIISCIEKNYNILTSIEANLS